MDKKVDNFMCYAIYTYFSHSIIITWPTMQCVGYLVDSAVDSGPMYWVFDGLA